MKKRIFAVATLVALGTSAFAFGGGNCQNMQPSSDVMQCGPRGDGMKHHGNGMGRGDRDDMMGGLHHVQQLNLTDEQRHKLAILQSEMKLEMTKLHDPKMMAKMQDLMVADTFNKKEFVKLHTEMHEKMVALKADHAEKVLNVLTKDQKAELKTLMSQKPQKPVAMQPAPAAPASK